MNERTAHGEQISRIWPTSSPGWHPQTRGGKQIQQHEFLKGDALPGTDRPLTKRECRLRVTERNTEAQNANQKPILEIPSHQQGWDDNSDTEEEKDDRCLLTMQRYSSLEDVPKEETSKATVASSSPAKTISNEGESSACATGKLIDMGTDWHAAIQRERLSRDLSLPDLYAGCWSTPSIINSRNGGAFEEGTENRVRDRSGAFLSERRKLLREYETFDLGKPAEPFHMECNNFAAIGTFPKQSVGVIRRSMTYEEYHRYRRLLEMTPVQDPPSRSSDAVRLMIQTLKRESQGPCSEKDSFRLASRRPPRGQVPPGIRRPEQHC